MTQVEIIPGFDQQAYKWVRKFIQFSSDFEAGTIYEAGSPDTQFYNTLKTNRPKMESKKLPYQIFLTLATVTDDVEIGAEERPYTTHKQA